MCQKGSLIRAWTARAMDDFPLLDAPWRNMIVQAGDTWPLARRSPSLHDDHDMSAHGSIDNGPFRRTRV
jgi:hypothetical protein